MRIIPRSLALRLPWRLGSAPVRTGPGGGAAAWIMGPGWSRYTGKRTQALHVRCSKDSLLVSGDSAPVRTATLLLGSQGPGSARCIGKAVIIGVEDMVALAEFSSVLWQLTPKGPSWLVLLFSIAWHRRYSRAPLTGVLLYCSAGQVLKGLPSLGSFSIGQLPAPACGESGHSDGSTRCLWLSSSALPPWLPSVPSKAFHAGFLPPGPWGCRPPSVNSSAGPGTAVHSHAPAPSRCAFRWTWVLVRGM